MALHEAEGFPAPPYPHRDDPLLLVITGAALQRLRDGAVDVEGAVRHAAVHAWYEGHLQGEDCPGCEG